MEGVRGVTEALGAGARSRFLLRSPRGDELWTSRLDDLVRESGTEVQAISDEEMAEVAGTETPQGVLLVAREPRPSPASIWDGGREKRILLLDGVQDPGNAGTLVRVAAAFRCTAVVALDGTTDLWSARAVRAAAGTTFRLPVLHQGWEEVSAALDATGTPLLMADAGGTPLRQVEPGPSWVLAMGGEGGGCRREVGERCTLRVAIPMPGGVESLNVGVAGAILLYDLTKGDGA